VQKKGTRQAKNSISTCPNANVRWENFCNQTIEVRSGEKTAAESQNTLRALD